jgi:hypothetical protein
MPISKSIKLKSLMSKSTLEFFFDVFFHASSFSNLGSIDISGHATSSIGTASSGVFSHFLNAKINGIDVKIPIYY